ncbi:hypothetical protein Rhow_004500 [Rhodococcus wratislaviensis]|uniref:Uncharacterized protein n=1 Tax=Rhodococcus wratislaviensis TaxID=44752 RepID=A0A402CBJ6_RHOWR|nr:hypothetical protein Rhow_004500 [Rhodococcus wratislaviensis]
MAAAAAIGKFDVACFDHAAQGVSLNPRRWLADGTRWSLRIR